MSIFTPKYFVAFMKALNPTFKKWGVSKFKEGQKIRIFSASLLFEDSSKSLYSNELNTLNLLPRNLKK